MAVLAAARGHYAVQAAIARRLARDLNRLWSSLDRGDLSGSWTRDRVGERLYVAVAASQVLAASQADPYLERVLDQQGIDPTPTALVNPQAFAGRASDGRNLESLLYQSVIRAKLTAAQGQAPERVMASGLAELTKVGVTQVQDAGRLAVGVATTARPQVGGYVRMLNPPSCSRCAVLAGQFYRWNKGFERHPMCNCVHVPSAENVAGDLTTDPAAYFESLASAEQERQFTKAGAEAIRDGADIGRVVNARRGMDTAAGTARGGRLLPERIYAKSRNRDEAIALLGEHGYLI